MVGCTLKPQTVLVKKEEAKLAALGSSERVGMIHLMVITHDFERHNGRDHLVQQYGLLGALAKEVVEEIQGLNEPYDEKGSVQYFMKTKELLEERFKNLGDFDYVETLPQEKEAIREYIQAHANNLRDNPWVTMTQSQANEAVFDKFLDFGFYVTHRAFRGGYQSDITVHSIWVLYDLSGNIVLEVRTRSRKYEVPDEMRREHEDFDDPVYLDPIMELTKENIEDFFLVWEGKKPRHGELVIED